MCKTISNQLPKSIVVLRRLHRYFDAMGVGASSLCAIHCMLMPFVVACLPMFGLQFMHHDDVHPFLAGFVVFFGITSIVPGYRKHKECAILMSMAVGLALVLLATFVIEPTLGGQWEMLVITAGNFLVVLAHVRNQKLLNSIHKEITL